MFWKNCFSLHTYIAVVGSLPLMGMFPELKVTRCILKAILSVLQFLYKVIESVILPMQ